MWVLLSHNLRDTNTWVCAPTGIIQPQSPVVLHLHVRCRKKKMQYSPGSPGTTIKHQILCLHIIHTLPAQSSKYPTVVDVAFMLYPHITLIRSCSIVNPIIMRERLDEEEEDLRYWCMTIIENNKQHILIASSHVTCHVIHKLTIQQQHSVARHIKHLIIVD